MARFSYSENENANEIHSLKRMLQLYRCFKSLKVLPNVHHDFVGLFEKEYETIINFSLYFNMSEGDSIVIKEKYKITQEFNSKLKILQTLFIRRHFNFNSS